MPTISGSLNLVTDRPVDSISEVWVRARETRGQGDGLTVGVNDRVSVTDGAVEFTALPGAAVLVLVQNGMPLETLPMVIGDEAQQSLRLVVQAGEVAGAADKGVIEQLAAEIAANVTRAEKYRTEAAASASAAQASQSAASKSASNAKTSETKAKTSETNAKASETKGKTSETNAASSAASALTHFNNAVAEAKKAAGSATAAKASETAAASSASASASSAASSKTQADKSATSATQAAASRDAAKASETAAAGSAAAAKTSETNSKQHETNAGDYAAVATTAATEAVDAMGRATEIVGGDFATREYVDGAVADALRVDTTVGTRVFFGDQMIYGNTGVRSVNDLVTGLDFTQRSHHGAYITREGDAVSLWGVGYALGELHLTELLPSGFRPPSNHYMSNAGTAASGSKTFLLGHHNQWTRITFSGSIPGKDTHLGIQARWITLDPWPTSLPGEPA